MRAVSLAISAGCAAGHGGLVSPPARNPSPIFWFNEGCQIGFHECKGLAPYGRLCNKDMEPTLDPALHTYFPVDHYKYHPWAAPGHSPVFSPCGIAAGESQGILPQLGNIPPPGYAPGFDGRNIPGGPVTEWTVGSVQEISWFIFANHGGGYAVRLCPKSAEQTEECFQKHHLHFVGHSSWIQYGKQRTEIRANRTTTGTHPRGSQWTKVPIPSCTGHAGGGFGCDDDGGCLAPQFESPIPGLWGHGPKNACAGCSEHQHCDFLHPFCNRNHCEKLFAFDIVDRVKVPDLPAGDYTLSFRWDCEQTSQIWAQCANIKIVSSALV